MLFGSCPRESCFLFSEFLMREAHRIHRRFILKLLMGRDIGANMGRLLPSLPSLERFVARARRCAICAGVKGPL